MKPPIRTPRERICVALDVPDVNTAKALTEKLVNYVGFFKIGFELFTNEGSGAVSAVREVGGKVFLDLKFHDIPATVAQAVVPATRLGVALLNLHASGGSEMMQKAAVAVAKTAEREKIDKPFLIAVTVLTSLDSKILKNELHVAGPLQDHVVHLAKLAMAAGLDGIVASPQEVVAVREACGQDCLIVTPGIRPLGVAAHDQKRTMTPKEAIRAGADIIVIGRAITGSPDPTDAAKRILDEIA